MNTIKDFSIVIAVFSCEYCPQKFSTKDERLTHTASHFLTQLCKDCNKILIRINDEWYGLHDICSKTEPDDLDFQNDTHFGEATEYHDEFIEDGADEVFNEPPPVQPIKQEIKSEHLSPNQQLQQPPRISPLSQNLAAKQNAGGQKVSSRRQNTKKKKQSSPKPAKRKIENQIKTTKRFKVSNKVWTDHRPAGTVTCDICNKVLRSFSTIGAHMKNLHSGKERVRCDECGESFSNVKEHKRVHLKYKAFVCSYCGKGFNHLRNLKEHAHMHTNEKPYDCKVCNKKFSRKTYLSSHSRTHTGEKPFKCSFEGCERAYAFGIDLKRHRFSAHGIYHKKYPCPVCSKIYSENKLLRKHLESHSKGSN